MSTKKSGRFKPADPEAVQVFKKQLRERMTKGREERKKDKLEALEKARQVVLKTAA